MQRATPNPRSDAPFGAATDFHARKRGAFLALTVGGLLVLASAVGAQETRAVRGRVVDSDGKPVVGVRLGTHWYFQEGGVTATWRSDVHSRENPEVRSDEEGAFSADLFFRGRPVALYALDLEGARGGFVVVTEQNVDDELVVELQPLVQLRGRVEITEPGLDGNPVYVYAFDPRAPIAVARAVLAEAGTFAFAFPAGTYKLTVSAKDLQPVAREVGLDAGSGVLDMGAIELFATNLAEHYGKPPPPWNVTEARGVSAEVQLSDYLGKWVLIEFWSYW